MDPKVSKKTQETLGKIIKRPPLTDKLLAKPPFRFLHDIITSVINTTGFMQGLYSLEEQNSDNVKDKESKIAFLLKALDIVSLVIDRQLQMKPSKVVAGHEPEKTNEFLQALAEAINKQVDNDSYVQRVLSSRETNKSHNEPNKEKDKSRDKSSSRRTDKEQSREKGERKESSRPQRDHSREKNEERDRHKSRTEEKERRHSKTEERVKEKERPNRSKMAEEKEEKEKEKEKEKGKSEEKSKEKRSSDADKTSRKSRKDDTKENEKPPVEKKESDEKIEEPAPRRLQRPTSAKGSRQKREENAASPAPPPPPPPSQDESSKEPVEETPSRPAKQVQMARPSSARPAPPKQRKSEVIATDPIIQLGSGQPANVITDDAQESDEDEQFIVEDNTPLQVAKSSMSKEPDAEDKTEHGGLVKKILETKKELEGANQAQNPQVETSSMNNIAYQKQRHLVVQKIEKLQASIQSLTKSANPLGKIMDYIQEDLDSMQKELQRWKHERIQHTMALKHEKEITERTVEPLKLQLASLEQSINDQMDVLAAVKANIVRNDNRIVSLLHSVAKV